MQSKKPTGRDNAIGTLRHEHAETMKLIDQFQRKIPNKPIPIDLADEVLMQYRDCIIQRTLPSGTRPIKNSEPNWVELESKIKSLLLQLLTGYTLKKREQL